MHGMEDFKIYGSKCNIIMLQYIHGHISRNLTETNMTVTESNLPHFAALTGRDRQVEIFCFCKYKKLRNISFLHTNLGKF